MNMRPQQKEIAVVGAIGMQAWKEGVTEYDETKVTEMLKLVCAEPQPLC